MKDHHSRFLPPGTPTPAFLVDLGPCPPNQDKEQEEAAFYRQLEEKYRAKHANTPTKPDWWYTREVVSPYVAASKRLTSSRLGSRASYKRPRLKPPSRPFTFCDWNSDISVGTSISRHSRATTAPTKLLRRSLPSASRRPSTVRGSKYQRVSTAASSSSRRRERATKPSHQRSLSSAESFMRCAGGDALRERDETRGMTVRGFLKEEDMEAMFMPTTLLYDNNGVSKHTKDELDLSDWLLCDKDLEVIQGINGPTCTSLNLTRCSHITDKGLAFLSTFTVLTKLVLEGCRGITDDSMITIRAYTYRLTLLNIRGCPITDHGIRVCVMACRRLSDFIAADLDGLTDKGMQAISQALKLYRAMRRLDLSGSRHFSNESLLLLLEDGGGILQRVSLSGCTQINELGLMGLRRTFKTSMDITRLNLSNTPIASPALCWISEGCKKLLHLNLSGCSRLADSAVLYLANQGVMPLRSLNLSGCVELTDYGMQALFESPVVVNLRSLDISDCILLGDHTLTTIAHSCPQLCHLVMAGVTKYTDASLKPLGEMCKKLLSVDMSMDLHLLDTTRRSRMPRYSSQGILHLTRHCISLRSIKLAGANRLDDAAVASLASCPDLRVLVLKGCSQITDEALIIIGQHCPLIEHVDISSCTLITSEGLIAIARGSQGGSLRQVNAQYCLKITDKALIELAQAAPNLEHLNLHGCDYVTDAGLMELARGATKLRSLNVKGCDEVVGTCLPVLAECCKSLTSLDMTMTKVQPDLITQAARQLPLATKGEHNGLLAVAPTLHNFNLWLVQFRKRMEAAETIQGLVRRYLNRCRYFHLRQHMSANAGEIQRVYRGFRGRKYAEWVRRKLLYGDAAATKIQKVVRGRIGRRRALQHKQLRRMHHAMAIIIQTAYRGRRCRRRYQRKKARHYRATIRWNRVVDTKLRRHHRRVVLSAMLGIQLAYRSFRVRRCNRSAALIQRVWRGHVVRSMVYDYQCRRLFVKHRAAAVIGKAWKKRRRRKRWARRYELLCYYERVYREEYQRRVRAANRIRRFYRRILDHRALNARIRARRSRHRIAVGCVVVIQCMYRCRLARREVRIRRADRERYLQTIRAKWAALARKLFAVRATVIQRFWRHCLLRCWSATVIQKTYRGYRARRDVLKKKRCKRLQIWLSYFHVIWSFNHMRRTLSRIKGAMHIQRFYRRYVIRVKWLNAVQWARGRAHEMRVKDQQRQRIMRERELVERAFRASRDRAAKKIQQTYRAYRHRIKVRVDMEKWEEARKRQEEARKLLEQQSKEQKRVNDTTRVPSTVTQGVGKVLGDFFTSKDPNSPEEMMKSIRAKVKKAERLGDRADEESRKLRAEHNQQFEGAVLKYQTRTTEMEGIVELKITVGSQERLALESKLSDAASTIGAFKVVDVDLSGSEGSGVFLFYRLGDGTKAFRNISIRDAPFMALRGERESRYKALRGVGISVVYHEKCRFELHCVQSMEKAERGFPVDAIKVTTNISQETELEGKGWTKLQPKLKKYGLASCYLWVHSKQVADVRTAAPNALTDELLGGFEWYDNRLKKVIFSYALAADTILKMYDNYRRLDFKGKGAVDNVVVLDSWEEQPCLYWRWILDSLELHDPITLKFSEYVNLITVLAMFESRDAKRFVFGNIDPERSGYAKKEVFLSMIRTLTQETVAVSYKKMKKMFEAHMDDYQTVNFDVFEAFLAVGGVMWPMERLMKKARDHSLGEAAWDEHKRQFQEARLRLDIHRQL